MPGYRWRGAVMLNGMSLKAGDGAAVSEEEKLEISERYRKYCCSIWVDITALVALDENFCRCHRSNGHNLAVRHHLDTVEPLRADEASLSAHWHRPIRRSFTLLGRDRLGNNFPTRLHKDLVE